MRRRNIIPLRLRLALHVRAGAGALDAGGRGWVCGWVRWVGVGRGRRDWE